jgi:hypothetical protein
MGMVLFEDVGPFQSSKTKAALAAFFLLVSGVQDFRGSSMFGFKVIPMSAFGTKQPPRHAQPMSAFGGKAEVAQTAECLLLTHNGLRSRSNPALHKS